MKTTQETTLYILLTSNRNSLTTTTRNKQISNTNEKLKTTQDQNSKITFTIISIYQYFSSISQGANLTVIPTCSKIDFYHRIEQVK